jgi:subtilase family serine protease
MLQSREIIHFTSTFSRRILFAGSFALAFGVSSLAVGQSVIATGPVGGHGTAPTQGGSSSLVPLTMEVPSVVQRSTYVGPTDKSQTLHLSINLNPPSPAALKAFADSVSNPTSPNYHKFITPKQVGQMFGQPAAMVQQVVAYCTSQGFKIKLVADDNIGILADCTVAQAESAFGVTINNYHAISSSEPGRQDFFSYSTQPQLPMSIAPVVLTVEGLQNFTKPKPRVGPLTPVQTRTLYSCASIYGANFQGQNRTMAISSWDGFRLTNVPLFVKAFNLPTPAGGAGSNITVVTVDGGSGAGTPSGEGDLDIQMPLASAPLAAFTVYDGGGDLTDVLTLEANNNTAAAISESYGWNLDAGTAQAAHNIHLTMTAQGITYMAAAGDSGTSLEPYSYPNYDGEVLMVGGTAPNYDTNGNRLSEPCWQDGGGGWSTNPAPFNVTPSWQKGKGVPTGIGTRLVPDLAFCAGGPNGSFQSFDFYFNGALGSGEGTSFASPCFLGMLTIAEQEVVAQGGLANAPHRFGRMQDLIYSQNGRPDAWFDVTSGSNGFLPNGQLSVATPGWDFTSGWGPMIMDGFVKAVSVTAPVTFAPFSASVFDNTYITPNETEGNYVSGNTASLAATDQNDFVISPISESGLGRVASLQGLYSTKLNPTLLATLNIAFTGYIPAPATVMLYIYNWNTNTYQLLESISGSAAANANNFSVQAVNGSFTNYMNASGQVQVLVRSLVPTSRQLEVGTYTFKVDQLTITATSHTN